MAFVEVRHLKKEFIVRKRRRSIAGSVHDLFQSNHTTVTAIDDIGFDIEQGECVGYVGPNGAGKTTTIRILAGILFPTAGTVTVGSVIPWQSREKYVRNVGMMFGNRNQLWPELSPIQSFDLLKSIYQVKDGAYRKNLDYLTGMLGIESLLDRPLRELSLGQKMRCELVSTFLHSPEIVFLDEPTIGLDFEVKANIREIILELNQQYKTTIILTSHDLHDIEKVCDRLMVINKGAVLFDGQMSALRAKYPTPRTLKIQAPDDTMRQLVSLLGPFTNNFAMKGGRLEIQFQPESFDLPTVLSTLGRYGKEVDVVIEDADIESTVTALYRSTEAHV